MMEVEYIVDGCYCSNSKQTLEDFRLHFGKVSMYCDNTSAASMMKNLI